jgi:hypothetical protein
VERQGLKQIQLLTVDVTKIEGNGDFSYPNRTVTISLEAKIRNVSLEELVIASIECVSNVRFLGFLSIRRR